MTASTYKTPAQAAAAIRTAYKALGFNRNDVSVRSESYSMGSSIRIMIKTAKLTRSVATKIAEREQDVRRDERGETLSGGNRFVFVDFTDEARDELAGPWIDQVRQAWESNNENESALAPIMGNFKRTDGRVVRASFANIQRKPYGMGHVWTGDGPMSQGAFNVSNAGDEHYERGIKDAAALVGQLAIEQGFTA